MERKMFTYIGPERRKERRVGADKKFEKLLRDFGLDRRSGLDRRQYLNTAKPSSLITSQNQARID